MQMWLDVQSAGSTIGAGPIVEIVNFSSEERLNRAGTWSALVPATDERSLDLLSSRRTVLAYGWINGERRFLGGGVIESMRVRIIADGPPMLEISGSDLLEELNRVPVGDISITQPGTYALSNYLTAGTPANWTTNAPTTGIPAFSARLVYDTFLGGLNSLAEKLPIWFRRLTTTGNPRTLDVLVALPSTIALHAVANADAVAIENNDAICLITNISEERQSADIVTSVIAFGAGNGNARLDMRLANQWPNGALLTGTYVPITGVTLAFNSSNNTITNASAPAAYGTLQRAIAWKDIAPLSNSATDLQSAANTLVSAACEYLVRHSAPHTVYSLDVAGVRRDIYPGDLIRVTARKFVDGEKPINIAANVRVLEVRSKIDNNGMRVTGLTVATLNRWPDEDADAIARDIRQNQVMEALPQMSASVDTISYREPLDDNYNADLRFWLGNETTTVNQVLIRFRIDPFRSTAKTVGGDVTGTVDIPDHTHDVAIGDHSHTTPDHSHTTTIADGSVLSILVSNVNLYQDSGIYYLGHENPGTGSYSVSTLPNGEGGGTSNNGGSTTVTSEDGGGTSNVSLSLTNSLTLEYGIHEETSGKTYGVTDLEWLVNGTLLTATPVSITGGWYALDITSNIVAANGLRPNQADNLITVRVKTASKTGKSAQITAQIERRTVIQAIAYI